MDGTVLVVDDDIEVTHTFGKWLQLEGYDVRTAADGAEALRQMPGVDVMIIDLRMPVLDGVGLLRQLRSQGARVPVLIVTGDYLVDESVMNELNALDARIVFKPLWVDELTAMTAELMPARGCA